MAQGVLARRATLAAAVVCALMLSLVACAPEPVRGWKPAQFAAVPGITLASIGDAALADPAGQVSVTGDAAIVAEAPAGPVRTGSNDDELYQGRLRNTAISFAARFVYVPGVPGFNDWVNEQLWAGIRTAEAASGAGYQPQVHPIGAGLASRGCVPGSLSWPAAQVLTRTETGVPGGSGTAVTCEVTGEFGTLIEVRMRTVTGVTAETPAADGDSDVAAGTSSAPVTTIQADEARMLYANVATGEIVEIVDEWTDEAPVELWRSVVELLRREAGGLSTAPVSEPDDEQRHLALWALETAHTGDTGELAVTLPAGLRAPELQGLGIASTQEPITVIVEPARALTWSNDDYRELQHAAGEPFTGTISPVHTVPLDCSLLPCVALTYDDGPGEFTGTLLDTLQQRQARVTFYMLGSRAGNTQVIARAAAEGHEIGSHTMTHPDLTTLPLDAAVAQVRDAAAVLGDVSGQPVTTFRPPYGAINNQIIDAVGMPAILWSVDTNDWRRPGQDALVERSVGVVKTGGIILFHDSHPDSVAVAGRVVEGLRDRGFELVTVTQLFDGSVPPGRVSSR
ncbi:MAG: polysaccharide deacetylase family protein [Microbacteriaceae bacterium]|nr:polysaccharide deacetylase family protein [Microbacteriaceae bacterium]